jgi:4-hydroxyphenylpyruvate dioxygenase
MATRDIDGMAAAIERRGGVIEKVDAAAGFGGADRRAIAAYGDTRLELVDAARAVGELWAGMTTVGLPSGAPVGLERIDHVVANVEEGRLDAWVEWHHRVIGLREMRRFDAEQISTEYSALRSTVMWNDGRVVLPINEPAPGRRTSQIEEFLDAYGGPGVQHIALATADIVATVTELTRRGVHFLVPSSTYYEDARRRVGDLPLDWGALERLGILVDIEQAGYLLQIFTDPIGDRPTVFFEVIEREGATGFGEGNFKALFEAIEREQARRGHLLERL